MSPHGLYIVFGLVGMFKMLIECVFENGFDFHVLRVSKQLHMLKTCLYIIWIVQCVYIVYTLLLDLFGCVCWCSGAFIAL